MEKETNLCMGCMQPLEAGNGKECPHCGYIDTGVYLSSYLKPKTLLSERYIVGKILSYNGEAAIYLGYDTQLNRKVTIKEYMPDTMCSRERNEVLISVNQEWLPLYKTYLLEFIELNKALYKNGSGLNIQKILHIFTENNTAYVIFDYVQGITLKSYLINCGGKLSWEEIKEMFAPLLTTMNVMQGLGITHRAISPSTILVTDKRELILIGFGISASRTVDSEINCEVFAGYAPPEQYSSSERNGSWTDIFGICAVLYRCLTGQNPPDVNSRKEKETLVEPMMINRSVPQNVSMVIMKGLRLPVDERIQTVNELVDRLFETVKPVRDNSLEIQIPSPKHGVRIEDEEDELPIEKVPKQSTKHPVNKSSNVKKSNARKKKKMNSTTTKAVIAGVAFGLVLMILVMITIITQFTQDEDEPAATTTATTTTAPAVTTTVTTTEITTTVAETTVSISNEISYMLPDFTNRFFDSVSENARYNYLNITATYEFNNEYGVGIIFDQDVASGTMVTAGTDINLKISKGAEFVELPDYNGQTADEYITALSKLSVKYETEEIESADVEEGYVVNCSKEIGDKINVAEGETITVFVALKPAETTTTTTTTKPETTKKTQTTPSETASPQTTTVPETPAETSEPDEEIFDIEEE